MAANQNAAQNARPNPATARHPPEFSLKDCFTTWFKQFRNYCELLNVPANTRYRTLLSFLDPECFTIVENLALPDERRADIFHADTQRALKDALSRRESRVPAGYAMRYRKQKEGESIEKYAAELEKLALEAYPDVQNIRANRNLIECFISGIRDDELAIKLLEENFNNLTETINRAVHYQQALQTRRFIKTETDFRPTMEKVYNISSEESAKVNTTEYRKPEPPATQQAQPANGNPFQYQGFQQNGNQFQNPSFQPNGYNQAPQQWYPQQVPSQYRQFPNTRQSFPSYQNFRSRQRQPYPGGQYQYQREPRRNLSQIICYFCEKPGHIKPECYSYKRHLQQQKQSKHCTYCNKQGHSADSCWHLIGFPSSKPFAPQGDSNNQASNSKNPFRPT